MDAFLLVSYGAPERQDEVLPFLENLFAGVPAKLRIAAAAEKYHDFARQTGRYSPLNDECRSLLRHLAGTPAVCAGVPAKLYWGNLFWHPMLEDTLAEMARDGVEKAVCFVTSAFECHAARQRYVEAIESARSRVGPSAPVIEMLPAPFAHPLFLRAQADRLLEALARVALDDFARQTGRDVLVLFTAHSILRTDAETSDYVAQLSETSRRVAELCHQPNWELVWQSRSAGRLEDWLGPDVGDRILKIAEEGRYGSVVVSPIGFFCENMETVRDLDLELGELCDGLGLRFVRARAVGASPEICRMIQDMTASHHPPTTHHPPPLS